MNIDEIARQILSPDDEFNRTAALRELVGELKAQEQFKLPAELATFLMRYETRDTVQAALIGLALFSTGAGAQLAAYARMFPVLGNHMEAGLASEVREAMAGHDIRQLYDNVTDLALNADPQSAEYHYGFLVLSSMAPDQLS